MSKIHSYHTTVKGTKLPLRDLRGKPYLEVAQRLVWFAEENPKYVIESTFPTMNNDETIALTKVVILDDKNQIIKQATGIKRETREDFSDHTEKAQTSSLGRALAMLGYGTQFTADELDEGDRIVDSPVEKAVRANAVTFPATLGDTTSVTVPSTPELATAEVARPSFKARRNLTTTVPVKDEL